MTIEFNLVQTIGFAVLLLVIGRYVRKHVNFFERFAIPAPVIGGFAFAIINLFLKMGNVVEIKFDTTLQSFFMIIFFTSIGYGASVKILKSAGPKVILFLVVASVLCIFQNAVAVILSKAIKFDPILGLMTGSTPMTGGHGTSGGIAPLVEAAGFTGAETIAFASATFGLLAGSLMGGPLANHLIMKKNLLNKRDPMEQQELDVAAQGALETTVRPLNGDRILRAFFALLIVMFLGSYISEFLNSIVAKFTDLASFPAYIGPMLLAILLRYISDSHLNAEGDGFLPTEEIEIVGNVGLNLFLAMALMTLDLIQLREFVGQMGLLLLAQTILMAIFAYFVTFKVMGGTYDAAVIAGGHCGFGMGATPNGVANMESITEKFVPSKTAFFVVPIVGGMFIDFANVFIIILFMTFLGAGV
ncbi:MAG: sodium/glutamate symporter [Peptoniphilaceae bacterium]|nr:sodium/glutamate symporter [Peptoniphilaceae bacterium]MDY6086120.1 sodium/glutamate symporter [Peptoniphilaceae bacterium]